MEKAQFKTGNVGVEFIDEAKVANKDTTVLPRMVNAKPLSALAEQDDASQAGE